MKTEKDQTTYITGPCYRFSLLTPQLIRMEYDPDGLFEDRPTQMVQNRNFASVDYNIWRTENRIEIKTAFINLFYDEKPFSPGGLWAENRSLCRGIYTTWHYGDPLKENLGGTARTLDEADGEIPLEAGVLSRLCGYSVLDDSNTPVLTEDGWFSVRKEGKKDLYLFAYGIDYKHAIRDFFTLCGKPPLLPRFALGNWWSRFYAYSDQEYIQLMDMFQQKGVPLSVAVIDMDWHIRDVGPEGKGWTGFTWNNALFPEPVHFLEELHCRGLKVTLNLHPAEGIQSHEACYPEVAKKIGKNGEKHQRIPFDVTDQEFMNVYFNSVLSPLEQEGIDFWWIDWQQGTQSSVQGVDPLWVLNHYHCAHCEKNRKRPLILSRYCGPGSHRYPIGFSGDTVISWESLRFQPFFTATAANIGYGWWSHDIGGHTRGIRDPELQVRWLQLGVFSPILRMHSTSNGFNGKEPWRYSSETERMMIDALRLRHQLIPYLYSVNWRCHTLGEMLVQPMYYDYPDQDEAYQVPNQFMFGSELMVMPITSPQIPDLELGCVIGWLPEGLYYDFFTGLQYRGNKMISIFRPLERPAVFAKAGAIIPLAGEKQTDPQNPAEMEIIIYAGADGQFALYEDDGDSFCYQQGEYSITQLSFRWNQGKDCVFSLCPGCDDKTYMPAQRNYHFHFVGLKCENAPTITVDGNAILSNNTGTISENAYDLYLPGIAIGAPVEISFTGVVTLVHNQVLAWQERVLNIAHISYELKDRIFQILTLGNNLSTICSTLFALKVPANLIAALLEPMNDL